MALPLHFQEWHLLLLLSSDLINASHPELVHILVPVKLIFSREIANVRIDDPEPDTMMSHKNPDVFNVSNTSDAQE